MEQNELNIMKILEIKGNILYIDEIDLQRRICNPNYFFMKCSFAFVIIRLNNCIILKFRRYFFPSS
jgi:hypothetical protein